MYKFVVVAMAGIGLASCSANNEPAIKRYPVEQIILNDYLKPTPTTLYAEITENGKPLGELILHYNSVPAEDTVFNNISVKSYAIKSLLTLNGKVVVNNEYTEYITTEPFTYVGSESDDDYSLVIEHNQLPKAAMIGENNDYYIAKNYTNANKEQLFSTDHVKWSVTAADDKNAWVCQNYKTNYIVDEVFEETSSSCYKVNTKGDILAQSYSIYRPKTSTKGIFDVTFNTKTE